MSRLTTEEAELVTTVAAAEQPPILDLHLCVQDLQLGRLERQLVEIQRQLAQLESSDTVNELLRQKNALRSQLELARRGPRDAYNK
jgi:hypothetical protein